MATYIDNNPYNIESPQQTYIVYSAPITYDYTRGTYPSGEEAGWIWESNFIPLSHTVTVNGSQITVAAHEFMKIKVGLNGRWTVPMKIAGVDGQSITDVEDLGSNVMQVSYGNGETAQIRLTGGTPGADGINGTNGTSVTVTSVSGGVEVSDGTTTVMVSDGLDGEPFQLDSTGDIATGTGKVGLDLDNDTGTTPIPSRPYFHLVNTDNRDDVSTSGVLPVINVVGTTDQNTDYNVSGHLIVCDGTNWLDYGQFTAINGTNGYNGWSPVLAVVADGTREVLKIQSWTGGTGTAPATAGQYIGLSGLETVIGNAVNIKGSAGADGGTGIPINLNVAAPLVIDYPLLDNDRNLSITRSTALVNGYLHASDFSSFKNKVGTVTASDPIQAVTTGTDVVITHKNTGVNDKHIPTGGSTGQALIHSGTSGTANWGNHNDITGMNGGTTGQYYHMTQTQYNDLTDEGSGTINIADSQHKHKQYIAFSDFGYKDTVTSLITSGQSMITVPLGMNGKRVTRIDWSCSTPGSGSDVCDIGIGQLNPPQTIKARDGLNLIPITSYSGYFTPVTNTLSTGGYIFIEYEPTGTSRKGLSVTLTVE